MPSAEAPNPNRDTWGRRCELGCESWPDSLEFNTCLRCGGPTKRYSNLQPMSLEEGRSALAHAKFTAYYEKHCAELGIPVSGPLK